SVTRPRRIAQAAASGNAFSVRAAGHWVSGDIAASSYRSHLIHSCGREFLTSRSLHSRRRIERVVMLTDKQRRHIRVGACVVTAGAAFLVTLQLQAPATDATSKPTAVVPAPPAAAKRESECSLLQHNGRLDRIPDDLKRAILKYALCDESDLSRTALR